jgi:hypothetical protein
MQDAGNGKSREDQARLLDGCGRDCAGEDAGHDPAGEGCPFVYSVTLR